MRLSQLYISVLFIALYAQNAFPQIEMRSAILNHSHSISAQDNFVAVQTDPQTHQRKSPLIAIAYSLILPGLGDLYAENFQAGRYFMGADVGLWITYGAFRVDGGWLKRDARAYATAQAGANFDGKSDAFGVDIGNFANTSDYNQAKLRNRQYDLLYDPNSTYSWQWQSDADREKYKNLRIRGDEVIRNSQFVLGVLVINRLISAIYAVRSVSAYNRNADALGSWRIKANVQGSVIAAHGIEISLTKEF